MNIVVLSGKGGAGKTFIAVNLAEVFEGASYFDYDVEEPNGHLFFKPDIDEVLDVELDVPRVNHNLCSSCRTCVDFCKFNALLYISGKVKVFDNFCHSCDGCRVLCSSGAIENIPKTVGKVYIGQSLGTKVYRGVLNTGEISSGALISCLNNLLDSSGTNIIDGPPGTACNTMDSLKKADYCLVVVEASLFGLENFKMLEELLRLFKKPFSVLVNKSGHGSGLIYDYCREKEIKIIADIGLDREIGLLNSRGRIAARENQDYRALFEGIRDDLREDYYERVGDS